MSAASLGRKKTEEHRANISKGQSGKPKPWMRGENNVNYGNRAQGRPDVRERFLDATKARGQAWTAEDRAKHRARMLGECNVMRGTKHSDEAKTRMSLAKKEQYKAGLVKLSGNKISKAEKEIRGVLAEHWPDVIAQHHINGVPFWYDFCIPSLSLLIEYQGDYWHANPRKYAPGTTLNIVRRGPVRVEDIWGRDELRRQSAISAGYGVVVIWEMDYKKGGREVVVKAVAAALNHSAEAA